MTLPKEHTTRTDEPIYHHGRLVMGVRQTSHEDHEECLTTNLNEGMKRYRATAENSSDLRPKYPNQLLQKIRVTQVPCSELGQLAKPENESCIP